VEEVAVEEEEEEKKKCTGLLLNAHLIHWVHNFDTVHNYGFVECYY
jgi:hypothetical protein